MSKTKRTHKGNSIIEDLSTYVVITSSKTKTRPQKIHEIAALKIIDDTVAENFYVDLALATAEQTQAALMKFSEFIGNHVLVGYKIIAKTSVFLYDAMEMHTNQHLSNDMIDLVRLALYRTPEGNPPTIQDLCTLYGVALEDSTALDLCQTLNSIYIKQREHIPPESYFGCCSQFLACSNAKRCIKQDRLFAKGCSYKKHLETGVIFYGDNRNID